MLRFFTRSFRVLKSSRVSCTKWISSNSKDDKSILSSARTPSQEMQAQSTPQHPKIPIFSHLPQSRSISQYPSYQSWAQSTSQFKKETQAKDKEKKEKKVPKRGAAPTGEVYRVLQAECSDLLIFKDVCIWEKRLKMIESGDEPTLLAIDVGAKYVGISILYTAHMDPSDCIWKNPGQTDSEFMELVCNNLLSLIQEKKSIGLVIGLPLKENGEMRTQFFDENHACLLLLRCLNSKAELFHDVGITFTNEYGSTKRTKFQWRKRIEDWKKDNDVEGVKLLDMSFELHEKFSRDLKLEKSDTTSLNVDRAMEIMATFVTTVALELAEESNSQYYN